MSSLRPFFFVAVSMALLGSACGSTTPRCLPSNCAGCCASDGSCVAVPSAAACGLRGNACVACVGDQQCLGGFCTGSGFGGGSSTGGGFGGGGETGGGGGETGGGGGSVTGGGGGATGGGGGATGGGGGATGGGGGSTATTAAQIVAVRAAADGPANLPVQGALVTFLKPLVPDAGSFDPIGFTVQAGGTGPALFVSVDPASLPVAVGDLIDFTVTAVTRIGQLRVASSISGFARQSGGNPVSGLTQSVSTIDFAAPGAIDEYESELVSLNGTLATDMAAAGSGYQSAGLVTSGNPDAGSMRLRLPNALADTQGLTAGCSIQVAGVPLWRFNAQAQPSPFTSTALSGSSCPAPRLVSAGALSLTSVRATFDRPMSGLSTANLSIGGLTVSQVTGSGSVYTLTTSTQTAGASYTLTAATNVFDVRGTPIDVNARTANFTGFQPPNLVINEVDYDNFVPNPDGGTSLADNAEFVEIYNPSTTATVSLTGLSLVFINGTGGATYLTVDLTSAGSLGPQEYLVAANATFLGTLPGTVKKVTIPGTTDLMQNGAPDGVALVAVATSTVLDALSYEGNTTSTTLGGSIQEGAAATTSLVDSNTAHASLCRIPNGSDTNVNATDFDVCSMPTPGATNVP